MSHQSAEQPEPPVLDRPSGGIPDVVDTPSRYDQAVRSLSAGTGPLAVDAERAQGFRYTGRAYLLQFRRAGAGTHLFDPVALERELGARGLPQLAAGIADAEWIIHAATQDLPCLAEEGLRPARLFDTELAGRLLGLPRVGLGPLIEHYFGVRLLKEHSAADWSRRPLPDEWLSYAALDVELLVELRDRLAEELIAAGKDEWARQEFDWLVHRPEAPEQRDRWRRTSGLHSVRTQLGLAVVRELWQTRDQIAARIDRAPSRVLPDQAIADLGGLVTPKHRVVPDAKALRSLPLFSRRTARQYETNWLQALDRVRALPTDQLPPLRNLPDAIPPPRAWADRHPEASARWHAVRPLVNKIAEQHTVPPENLLTPEFLRRLAWQPPAEADADGVRAALTESGARAWQCDLLAEPLAAALAGSGASSQPE